MQASTVEKRLAFDGKIEYLIGLVKCANNFGRTSTISLNLRLKVKCLMLFEYTIPDQIPIHHPIFDEHYW